MTPFVNHSDEYIELKAAKEQMARIQKSEFVHT